jgi:hypothetical protein
MANLKMGHRDVRPDLPSHVPGVKAGNSTGNYERQPGHRPDGTADARRSTGISPPRRDPIDLRMPNLPPA